MEGRPRYAPLGQGARLRDGGVAADDGAPVALAAVLFDPGAAEPIIVEATADGFAPARVSIPTSADASAVDTSARFHSDDRKTSSTINRPRSGSSRGTDRSFSSNSSKMVVIL